jgi:hypothetical protein
VSKFSAVSVVQLRFLYCFIFFSVFRAWNPEVFVLFTFEFFPLLWILPPPPSRFSVLAAKRFRKKEFSELFLQFQFDLRKYYKSLFSASFYAFTGRISVE